MTNSDQVIASGLNDSTELEGYYAELANQHEDDTGVPRGAWVMPYSSLAKYLVARQPVRAIGRRPIDWMKRDLLFGTTGDDPRSWFYRKTLSNKPPFLLHDRDQLTKKSDESVVRQSRAFDYSHRHHLLGLNAALPVGSIEKQVIDSALDCPTCLYETFLRLKPKAGSRKRSPVCKQVWLCPHCYCRRTVSHFEYAQRKLAEEPPAFIALLTDERLLGPETQNNGHVVLKDLRNGLLQLARSMGGTGGIWTQQISPELYQADTWHGNVVDKSETECLGVRVAVMAVIPKTIVSLKLFRAFGCDSHLKSRSIRFDHVRYEPDKALRFVLAKRLVKRGWGYTSYSTQNDHGLFYWPLLAVSSVEQWLARFGLTRNQPAVRRWGSWSKQGRSSGNLETASKSCHFHLEDNLNAATQEKARQMIVGFIHTLKATLNKMPGRVRLINELRKQGVLVTEREVREALRRYKENRKDER